MYRTAVKPQSVVQEVQVMTGLHGYAMLDTSRLHCCVFLTLSHPVSKEACLQSNLGLPRTFLVGGHQVSKWHPAWLLAGRVFSCQMLCC